jgi:hypothetical protein
LHSDRVSGHVYDIATGRVTTIIDARYPREGLQPGQRQDPRVTQSAGRRMMLDVVGEIGPVLKVIASHDPVDLTARPADLDELFLDFYRTSPETEASHAG